MKVVGLTGGIATGKTTVTNFLNNLNVPIIDADIINFHLLEPKQLGYLGILKLFPDTPLLNNKALDKSYLKNKLFNSQSNKTKIEALLHPLIKHEIKHQINNLNQTTNTSYCIVVVPLLIESNFTDLVDEIWVTDCYENTQKKRLMKRDHISSDNVDLIMSHQLSRTARLEYASQIISTDNEKDMEIKLKQLHQSLIS